MKILLNQAPTDGNGEKAEPPISAKAVENGMTEKEFLELREENKKLHEQNEAAAAAKKKLETDNAHLADQVHQLKQIPAPTKPKADAAQAQKSSWFFS